MNFWGEQEAERKHLQCNTKALQYLYKMRILEGVWNML